MSSPLLPEQAPSESDEELMVSVSRGDLRAFEELVRRHQTSAWNAAYRFLGDRSEAEDIVQDAFLRIFAAAVRYRPTAKFRTYLYRVIANLCLDRAERKSPRYAETIRDVPAGNDSPLTVATATEAQTKIRRALDRLPPQQRMAVILKYYDGLPTAEIAASMETTPKAVERLLARARETLETILTPLVE